MFALSGAEANQASDPVQGTLLLNTQPCNVLFDSGATHSFISFECVNRLNLPLSDSPYCFRIETSTNFPVLTSKVCLDCSVKVLGRVSSIDLVVTLSQLDVILSMEWTNPAREAFTGREEN